LRRVVSEGLEPWLVFLVVVGFYLASWWRGVTLGEVDMRLDDRVAWANLAVEGVFALVLGLWLWWRGWGLDAMTEPAGPFDVVRGIGLWFVTMLALAAAFGLLTLVNKEYADSLGKLPLDIALTRPVILVLSILNAVFEEFLWLAYGVTALGRRLGRSRACALSVAFRTAIHAYQGTLALVGVLPIGLVFTAYFALSRRVWPVIVAHALQDALVLGSVVAAAQSAR
jgi:membrane protease YdiL (CAAX protease family)